MEPRFRTQEQFILDHLQSIMIQDSLESSRPLHSNEIFQSRVSLLFDLIPYEKGSNVWHYFSTYKNQQIYIWISFFIGSCIVRMCAGIIGYDTFVRGMNRFLNAQYYWLRQTG